MSNDINLDPARVRSAMSRASSEIIAARRLEKAALVARAKAAKIGEVWGFVVDGNDIGERCTNIEDFDGYRCARVQGHKDSHAAETREGPMLRWES